MRDQFRLPTSCRLREIQACPGSPEDISYLLSFLKNGTTQRAICTIAGVYICSCCNQPLYYVCVSTRGCVYQRSSAIVRCGVHIRTGCQQHLCYAEETFMCSYHKRRIIEIGITRQLINISPSLNQCLSSLLMIHAKCRGQRNPPLIVCCIDIGPLCKERQHLLCVAFFALLQ